MTCHPSAHRCVDPARQDLDPPQIVATHAADTFHVTIVFNEEIDAGASGDATLAITPTLAITTWQLLPSAREVEVEVDAQTPGSTYTLSVSGFVDLYGNALADTTATFTGFGAFPERDPPDILAPSASDPLADGHVTLAWSPRALATTYIVDIATDAEFVNPLAASPYVVDAPRTTCDVTVSENIRYYWRVRADTTTPGQFGASTFDKLGTTLYVYCPSDAATCDDAGHAGNISSPLQTLAAAVARASVIGATEILVAERGGDATYDAGTVLSGTLALRGGYDSSFDESLRIPLAHVTYLASATLPALIILGGAGTITVDGLTISAPESNGIDVRGVYSGRVVLSNLVIAAGNAAVSVADTDTTQADRVHIEGCTTSALLGAGATVGVNIEQAGVTLMMNTITNTGRGVSASASNVVITSNTIDASVLQYNSMLGIYAIDSSLIIRSNFVQAAGGTGEALALDVLASTGATQRCEIVNNVFVSGEGSPFSRNFLGPTTADVVVTNNLFLVSAADTSIPLESLVNVTGEAIFADNIFASMGGGATCLYLFAGAELTDLRANAFVGCSGSLYQHDSTVLGQLSDVNNPAMLGQSSTPAGGGNYEFASFAAIGLDASYNLAGSTPSTIRFSGIDTRGANCGHAGNASCGGVTTDKANVPRTCPSAGACVSMGPFERDVP